MGRGSSASEILAGTPKAFTKQQAARFLALKLYERGIQRVSCDLAKTRAPPGKLADECDSLELLRQEDKPKEQCSLCHEFLFGGYNRSGPSAPVCLIPDNAGLWASVVPCGHRFHYGCIRSWKGNNGGGACPKCTVLCE